MLRKRVSRVFQAWKTLLRLSLVSFVSLLSAGPVKNLPRPVIPSLPFPSSLPRSGSLPGSKETLQGSSRHFSSLFSNILSNISLYSSQSWQHQRHVSPPLWPDSPTSTCVVSHPSQKTQCFSVLFKPFNSVPHAQVDNVASGALVQALDDSNLHKQHIMGRSIVQFIQQHSKQSWSILHHVLYMFTNCLFMQFKIEFGRMTASSLSSGLLLRLHSMTMVPGPRTYRAEGDLSCIKKPLNTDSS